MLLPQFADAFLVWLSSAHRYGAEFANFAWVRVVIWPAAKPEILLAYPWAQRAPSGGCG